MIPSDATHKWLPAVERPWANSWTFQRAYYKKIDGDWYSYSIDKEWMKSNNDLEWFETETREGRFVEIKEQ